MPTSKVTSKGQITIPAEMRKELGLKPGARIDFHRNEEGRYVLYPKTGSIQDLKGCVPKLDHPVSIEEMNEGIGAAVMESYLRSISKPSQSESTGSKDEAA